MKQLIFYIDNCFTTITINHALMYLSLCACLLYTYVIKFFAENGHLMRVYKITNYVGLATTTPVR